jgi:hypothetical protein
MSQESVVRVSSRLSTYTIECRRRAMAQASNPTYTSLRSLEPFPSFAKCPHENSVPSSYYRQRSEGVSSPARHWCLLGEITDSRVFGRLRLWVRDKEGEIVPVYFHLDTVSTERPFARIIEPGVGLPDHPNVPAHLISNGNTIAILYAQRHNFMDMTTGLRIEDGGAVQALQFADTALTASKVD